MPQHFRIVTLALGIGLLLALLVLFFIPEEIPRTTSLFPNGSAENQLAPIETDVELLRKANDEMIAIDQEYNFNEEPGQETLASPTFTLDAETQ